MDEENPNNYDYMLDLRMPSDAPVVGVRITPYARALVRAQNFLQNKAQFKIPRLTVAKFRHQFVFKANPQPPIMSSWFRKKLITCSVHPSIVATVQCISCAGLNMKDKSHYCSAQCFKSDWVRHKIFHCNAAESETNFVNQQELIHTIRRSGSWPQSLDEIPEQGGEEWVQVASSETYVPSNDDINSLLMLECVVIDPENGNPLSLVQRRVITNPVITFPDCSPRRMIKIGSNYNDGLEFSVLSYNILADIHAKNHLCCPRWALEWDYRKQNLLKEINEYDADIICLQEVQENHYKDFFEPKLTGRGYSALYKRKTNINEIYSGEGYIYEGCAIFYRVDKFELIMKEEVEFDKNTPVEALEPEQGKDGSIAIPRIKPNVALVAVLRLKNGSTGCNLPSRICLANTHLYAGRNHSDLRVSQVATLIHKLQEIAQSQNIPILLCGDLNSAPGSDPHRLIKQGINYREGSGNIRGVINLESAYAEFLSSSGIEQKHLLTIMDPVNREPWFTYFSPHYSATLDYIFYTADDRLKVVGLLQLPSERSLGGPLPSPYWSSDHIALMARFRLLSQTAFHHLDHQGRRKTSNQFQDLRKIFGKEENSCMW